MAGVSKAASNAHLATSSKPRRNENSAGKQKSHAGIGDPQAQARPANPVRDPEEAVWDLCGPVAAVVPEAEEQEVSELDSAKEGIRIRFQGEVDLSSKFTPALGRECVSEQLVAIPLFG